MKQLILVRHAKSSWDDPSLPDMERTLNGRGKRNAPDMANRLMKKGIQPRLLVSSPATRAMETAKLFAKEMNISKKDILIRPELYMADKSAFEQVIKELPEEADSVMIFSHNPGITEFANSLSNARIDNMPTASVFALKMHTPEWKVFREHEIDFWFFDYPKSTT